MATDVRISITIIIIMGALAGRCGASSGLPTKPITRALPAPGAHPGLLGVAGPPAALRLADSNAKYE